MKMKMRRERKENKGTKNNKKWEEKMEKKVKFKLHLCLNVSFNFHAINKMLLCRSLLGIKKCFK